MLLEVALRRLLVTAALYIMIKSKKSLLKILCRQILLNKYSSGKEVTNAWARRIHIMTSCLYHITGT